MKQQTNEFESAAAILQAEHWRNLAKARIEAIYPVYRQLNLLRAGTDEEKAKMSTFIDACRTWSNGESPDPAALEAIQP